MKLNKNAKALLCAVKKGYTISKKGEITGLRGNILKGYKNSKGYLTFSIRDYNGVSHTIPFHRLQMYTKYGDVIFNNGIVTRHKNNDPLDNSWDNILIGNQSMNMMDKPKELRTSMAKHAASFLKKYDNDKIKKFHEKHKSYKMTMHEFNIPSKGSLNYILKAKLYKQSKKV